MKSGDTPNVSNTKWGVSDRQLMKFRVILHKWGVSDRYSNISFVSHKKGVSENNLMQ